MYTCKCTHTYIYINRFIHVYIYICTHVNVHIYTCEYIYVYIAYMYTHIYMWPPRDWQLVSSPFLSYSLARTNFKLLSRASRVDVSKQSSLFACPGYFLVFSRQSNSYERVTCSSRERALSLCVRVTLSCSHPLVFARESNSNLAQKSSHFVCLSPLCVSEPVSSLFLVPPPFASLSPSPSSVPSLSLQMRGRANGAVGWLHVADSLHCQLS